MQNSIVKKSLVIGIIILFVGVGILSIVSSKDTTDLKPIENKVAFDNYDEIISKVKGTGVLMDVSGSFFGFFIFWKLRLEGGIFHITAITRNPGNRIYTATANKIYIPFCIGSINPVPPVDIQFIGWTFGNIEWE